MRIPKQPKVPPKSYLLTEFKNSLYEIPQHLEDYDYIFKNQYDFDNTVNFNIKGFVSNTLSFYNNYTNSSLINTILNIKSSKIYGNNVDIIVSSDRDSNYNVTLYSTFSTLTKSLLSYGKALLVLNTYSPNILEVDFRVIEPYRYLIVDNTLIILNYDHNLGLTEERRYKKNNLWVIELYTVEFKTTNNYTTTLEYTLVSSVTSNITNFWEYHGEGDIYKIRELVLAFDYTNTQLLKEVKTTKTTLHTDTEFVNPIVFDADLIETYETPTRSGEAFFKMVQPTIRATEYTAILDRYISSIANAIGISGSVLGIKNNSSTKTASQQDSEDATTIDTINTAKLQLQHQLNNTIGVMFNLTFNLKSYNLVSKATLVSISQKSTLSIRDRIILENPTLTMAEVELMTVKYKLENGLYLFPYELTFAQQNDLIDENYVI